MVNRSDFWFESMGLDAYCSLKRLQPLVMNRIIPFGSDRVSSRCAGCGLFVYCQLDESHHDRKDHRSIYRSQAGVTASRLPLAELIRLGRGQAAFVCFIVTSQVSGWPPGSDGMCMCVHPDTTLTHLCFWVKFAHWDKKKPPALMRIRFSLTDKGLRRQWASGFVFCYALSGGFCSSENVTLMISTVRVWAQGTDHVATGNWWTCLAFVF